MTALALGTALALIALAFVLYPLFTSAGDDAPPPLQRREPSDAERAEEALREVEFDRATGKLSPQDYEALRSAYTAEVVQAMRTEEQSAPPPDEAEALIERFRGMVAVCPECGERPEPAAEFCSSCGRRLH